MVPGGGAPHQEVQSRWESPSSDTIKTLLRDSSVHVINVTQQPTRYKFMVDRFYFLFQAWYT